MHTTRIVTRDWAIEYLRGVVNTPEDIMSTIFELGTTTIQEVLNDQSKDGFVYYVVHDVELYDQEAIKYG